MHLFRHYFSSIYIEERKTKFLFFSYVLKPKTKKIKPAFYLFIKTLIFSLLKDKKLTRLKSPRQILIWKIHSSKDSYALCTGSLYSFLFSFHLPPLPNTLLILSLSLNIYTTLSWLLPHQWIAFFQSSSLKNTPRKYCLGKFPPQENCPPQKIPSAPET